MLASESSTDAAHLLAAWRSGNLAARDRLFALLYPDLRRAAAALIRREPGVSFSTADLVNEAAARLINLDRIACADRAHFLALAARMMRRALLDHARHHRAAKRAHERVDLHTGIPGTPVLELDELCEALNRLAAIDPVRADIVEMRYFGGMELGEIAAVLGLSESTVKRRWNGARLWLLEALTPEG